MKFNENPHQIVSKNKKTGLMPGFLGINTYLLFSDPIESAFIRNCIKSSIFSLNS